MSGVEAWSSELDRRQLGLVRMARANTERAATGAAVAANVTTDRGPPPVNGDGLDEVCRVMEAQRGSGHGRAAEGERGYRPPKPGDDLTRGR